MLSLEAKLRIAKAALLEICLNWHEDNPDKYFLNCEASNIADKALKVIDGNEI